MDDRRPPCALLIALMLAACGGGGEGELHERVEREEGPPAEAADRSGDRGADEGAAEDGAEEAPEEGTGVPPLPPEVVPAAAENAGGEGEGAEDGPDVDDTVATALAEAEAHEVGASECDAAYESVRAMVRAVAAQFPDEVREMPPRALFVDACEQLPEPARRCLLPRYAVAHAEECRQVTENLPARDRARMEDLLGGR
ncbi:MAG TPA: hypothetical protein RMH85_09210 [Polyangiaceae bacterium LLY-WYZ-15_(1-7)]|nr:hypothetical protein [Myxococcales bacterium]HJK91433.1 hypothetical protein [Polyangiaceae bacterium LLY-WYZ-15_(1-7)]HJL01624.1 hypothetical protein [Polyangiaceae bacterium LLY-WYZ-15_(1-7)]HJL08664.1 hypothetical protein [Polyangiaceae bacterium LLY-WYZ-15_(1-7)]HJL32198.1 hypothetical protein [Polyangiaceae bacterium LLY-WYZ-15_(1-7)]